MGTRPNEVRVDRSPWAPSPAVSGGSAKLLWLLLILLSFSSRCLAHRSSDGFVKLAVEGTSGRGQWDLGLTDLDLAVGLDENNDGVITWGELQARERVVKAFAITHFEVEADGKPYELRVEEVAVSHLSDSTYAALKIAVDFSTPPGRLRVCYRAFVDLDPLHQGFVTLEHRGQSATAVLSPKSDCHEFDLSSMGPWQQAWSFFKNGVWHIWTGYDHVLFLLALLLPSVVERRAEGKWEGVDRFRPALLHVVKVVTAFTIAHSITLGIGVLGWARLPSRWVETTIAASVVLAALNNLRPIFRERGWCVAFGFGLVHGFGFASVLEDMELERESVATALVTFNAGVEAGQMAIVCLFLPVAFLIRKTWGYQRLTLNGGSTIIALLAIVWTIERAFEVKILGNN